MGVCVCEITGRGGVDEDCFFLGERGWRRRSGRKGQNKEYVLHQSLLFERHEGKPKNDPREQVDVDLISGEQKN